MSAQRHKILFFLNRCLIAARNIQLIDACFYHYIRRENSLDSQKLPDVSLKSEILATNLILSELNKNYPRRLNKEEYAIAYTARCHIFMGSFFRTASKELKQIEIESLINAYDNCKEKEKFLYLAKLLPLENFLKKHDVINLQILFHQCISYKDFCRKLPFSYLRNNIKKDA